MSDKDRSRADDSRRGGGGSGGADDDDGEGHASKEDKFKGCERKGKKVSLLWQRKKSKKLVHQNRAQKGVSVNSGRRGRKLSGGGGWCCFCLAQPRTQDSLGESPTSDPNSSEFTFDRLRALIENNDFYSKECNPHLDADICAKENS